MFMAARTAAGQSAARATRQRCRAAGLSEFVDLVSGGLSDMDGERAALEILERPELPTAILAFNDHCAAGVLAAVRAQRLRVPGDISVVGFDNVGLADLATVRLTTIDQDAHELARQAMDRAVARINGGIPVETVIEPSLVKRETVGPPPIATPDPLRS